MCIASASVYSAVTQHCFVAGVQIVQLLVHYGAEVNAVNISNNTPLHFSCQAPHLSVIAFCLVIVCATFAVLAVQWCSNGARGSKLAKIVFF